MKVVFTKFNLVILLSFLSFFSMSIYAQSMDKIFDRGLQSMNDLDYRSAIVDFTTVLKKDSSVIEAIFNRASSYYQLRLYNEALIDLNSFLSKSHSINEAYFMRSYIYMQQNKIEIALNDINTYIDVDQTNSDAYYNRGLILYELRSYAECLDDFNEAISLKNDKYEYFQSRAFLYLNLRDTAASIRDYKTAIELDSTVFKLYIDRSDVYLCIGEYEKALSDLDAALRHGCEPEIGYTKRGFINFKLEKKEEAINDYRQAYILNANNAELNYNMALWYYNNEDDMSNALKYINKSILLDTTSTVSYLLRIYINASLDKNKEVIADCNKYLSMDSFDYKIYYFIVVSTMSMKKNLISKIEKDLMLRYINKCIELNESFASAYRARGGLKMDIKLPGACEDFKKAISLGDPMTPAEYKACGCK